MEGKILSCTSAILDSVSCYRLQFEYEGGVDHAYVGAFSPDALARYDYLLISLLWPSPTATISVQPKGAAESVELSCPDVVKAGMGWSY